MGLNYEAAAKLFREGEFLQLIRASGHQEERHALEPRHRVILANALALVGELTEAQRLAEIDRHPTAPPSVRSQAELTLAMVSWRDGDLNSAVRLAQSAVHLAQESNEPERIAWAYLHLFRLLAEGGPIETVLGALPDVRRAVARAGVGQATAYLHLCVAILEGQTGRLDEARRHCDIAGSLLDLSSNVWLRGVSLVNRGCIACLSCEFEKATDLLRAAREVARTSGHSYLALATDATTGYVQLLNRSV